MVDAYSELEIRRQLAKNKSSSFTVKFNVEFDSDVTKQLRGIPLQARIIPEFAKGVQFYWTLSYSEGNKVFRRMVPMHGGGKTISIDTFNLFPGQYCLEIFAVKKEETAGYNFYTVMIVLPPDRRREK